MADKKKPNGMTKRELIKEMSDMTGLRTEAAEDLLNAFISIFIRETVINEKFYLTNCFTVDSYERGRRKGYNKKLEKVVEYPESRVLRIKLSPKVKDLYRWKRRNINNLKYGVTDETWTEILDDEGNIKEDFDEKG